MKKLLLAGTIMGALAIPAYADVIDPLQGVCGACVEVGGNRTPITQAQADTEFGFRIDPSQQVNILKLVFLVPVTISAPPTISLDELNVNTLAVTQALSATAGGTWTLAGGQTLSQFLGLGNVTPNNPFNAFQVGVDTSVTAFNVYTVNVDTSLLGALCSCNTPADEFKLLTTFAAAGVDIVAFANTAGGEVATAPSGQLQITTNAAVPGPVAGAGLPGLVGGCMTLLGLGRLRRKRNLTA